MICNPNLIFDGCANYRGVRICICGKIINWEKIAEQNNIIADNQAELVAWMLYNKTPLKDLQGDYVILHHESVRT